MDSFGKVLNLQCPSGETINIVDGYYGRTDSETCAEGVPAPLVSDKKKSKVLRFLKKCFKYLGQQYGVSRKQSAVAAESIVC